ncbi:N-6 DNA methylase [Flavobacterium ardleyense]|uniref:site-specific DNA-methyltransferase (adenine-specific) n=1 Tax=Flavobacterium ardleyense TaxID=2038737 RepID=A0ABW5Z3V3_9FLAO
MMKDREIDNQYINNISSEIWRLFENLRGSVPIEDYNVILLLLSGIKDNVLDAYYVNDSYSIHNAVIKSFAQDFKYSKVIEIYAPIIKFIPGEKLIQVINSFQYFDNSILKEQFQEIFDTLVYKLSEAQGKYTGEYIQPYEITRFIMNLAKIKANDTIYNPFAGLASYATFLDNSNHYYGQEINHKTWALGYLRLLAHNLKDFDYKLEDSLENWNRFGEFDLIVSTPPFNLRANNRNYGRVNFSLESVIIEHSLHQLNYSGELICVFPESFLYKKNRSDFQLKKHLIENNLINTIISLPNSVFKHTAIGTCVVIVNKKKAYKNKVRFIDATSFVNSKTNNRDKLFDDINLFQHIEDGNKKFVQLVDKETIIENDYNLLVSRYFIDDNFKGVRLHEICSFIRGSRSEKDEIGKLVKIRNLKDSIVNFNLDIEEFEDKEIPSTGISKIQQSCLLVALRWRTLKPTYFEYNGEAIYITNDILAFKIDKKIVNINYLINEFNVDYVLNQLEGLRLTGIIPTLRKDDFFQIKVKLPSIEEQKKKYYSFADKYIKSKVQESEFDFNEKKINVEDENSFLRHQIAGSLKNIRGAFDFVKRILDEQVKQQIPDLDNFKADARLETTLSSYINIIDRDLISVNKAVNKAGDKIDLLDLNIEYFDLLLFIKEYAESLKIRAKNLFAVILDLDENAIIEYGISGIQIHGDKDIIRKMFDNIIENAEKHAFTNSINSGNKIKIELQYDFEDDNVQIDISNTGNPIPESLTYNSMIRKGSSSGKNSGDGLGIWFVNEVMKIHKGKFGYTDETGSEGIDGEYVTTMELTFPLIQAL